MTISRALAAASGAVLAVAMTACGTASAHAPAPRASTVRPAFAGCGKPPPRHAWAVKVTDAGRIAWQTALPTRSTFLSGQQPPVAAGAVALFAQDGVVRGLSLATGRPLWSWPGGQSVYGMWRAGGLVAVLTDQVSPHAKLTGLDAATGAVRWTLRLPGEGLLGGQAVTGAVLAMVRADGVLQAVSLSSGRVLWAHRLGRSPGLAAAAGVVLFANGGRLTGFAAGTGQELWTRSGLPGRSQVQVLGGLALVTSNGSGPGTSAAVAAVNPATGRREWTFNPGSAVTLLTAGPPGLAVATYVPKRRLYLLDARTGRPRWRVTTAVTLDYNSPLLTARNLVSEEGGVDGFPVMRLVSRSAATGKVAWEDPASSGVQQPVRDTAGQAVVQAAGRRASSPAPLLAYSLASGRPLWRALMPTFVQVPPVPVPGGLLIQPADPPYACAT